MSRNYTKVPAQERFENKIERITESGCYIWMGATNQKGYGCFFKDGKMVKAHRYSYEEHEGEIPEELLIDHLCRVRCCVNPEHLEAVTNQENVSRGKKLITSCPQGHEYTKENTYFYNNARYCRACNIRKSKERRM